MRPIWLSMLIFLLCIARLAHGQDAVRPGELTIDPPTLLCLGFALDIDGDDNRNASATVEYRQKDTGDWKKALPLLRVGDYHVGRTSDWLDVKTKPMLAGSIFALEPDHEYEVRITIKDPDGVEGEAVRTALCRTRKEPVVPEGGKVYHVFPPGKKARWPQHEYNNLYKAYYGGLGNLGDFNMVWEKPIEAGAVILVHGGVYKANLEHYTDKTGLVSDGTYWLTVKGAPEKPITIKAAGDGEVMRKKAKREKATKEK